MKSNYICALDLGSSKIAAVLACISRKGFITSLFLESIPSKGIKMGRVIDAADFSDCVNRILRSLRVKSNIHIKSVYVDIYGQDIVTKHSRAIIPLTERGSKLITDYDVRRVIREAEILGANIEEDTIHRIPLSYTVDNQDNIANPVGLYGHKLEVDLYLVSAKLPYIQGLHRAIEQAGCQIEGMFLSGLATSKIIFHNEVFRRGVHIVCDIGSDITEILVFKNGILQSIDTLLIGGDDLTQALAQAFKIPFGLAQDLKESYGLIGQFDASRDKEVMIKEENLYRTFSQSALCKIVTSRADGLGDAIKSALDRIVSKEENVDDITVAGRAILSEGFLETLEAKLDFPVKMATFANTALFTEIKKDFLSSSARFLNYATCLGMIQQAIESLYIRNRFMGVYPFSNPITAFINRAKELYQEYF